MIPHTQAFKRLKDDAQSIFDFAIMVCYAVPSLKAHFKNLPAGSPLPFAPEYFDTRPIPTESVRNHTKIYKEVLSRHILLSSFSYFEAYFIDLLKEIIEFHGGSDFLNQFSITKNGKISTPTLLEEKRKLKEYRRKKYDRKYISSGKQLAANGFIFPSYILAQWGLKQFIDKKIDEEWIKAAEIPDLIERLLQLRLEPKMERERYFNLKETRNNIAHGRTKLVNLNLAKAVEANDFLRNLALKIDKHVLENLLLVELRE